MLKKIVIALLSLLLVACVTTEPKLFAKNVSKERELQSRLDVAEAYLQDDQAEVAMKHLKMAMDIDPKSPRLHEVLALTLEKMGDDDQVDKHFRKMVSLDGSYTRGRSNYGSYLMRKERYEDAVEQLSKVSDDIYYPNRAQTYFQLGICEQKLGKPQDAVNYFHKSATLDKSYAPALFELANYSYMQGKYPEAQQVYERFRQSSKQASPQSLLLGIKLARVFHDKDEESSYALALKNLFPKSQEYLDYQSMKNE